MEYCTNCGRETTAKKVCEHCGVVHGKKQNCCRWCGAAFEANVRICANCGEPKKDSSFLGSIFRGILAAILFLCAIACLPGSTLLALFVFAVGLLQLPFARRIFRKATHGNLKCRKLIRWVATPVLTVLVFLSINYSLDVSGYITAVEHWENRSYAAAMNYFENCSGYQDADAYIEKFESDVLASLQETPWCSGFVFCDTISGKDARWDYVFNADGTVLRREQIWDGVVSSRYKMDSYKDYTFKYTLEYGVDDETGIYEVWIVLNDTNHTKYSLYLGYTDEGTIVVNGFTGNMTVYDQSNPGQYNHVSKTVEETFSRDSHLPELD